MIPVQQRHPYDCMTACLASIFECPYEDAPVLCDPTTNKALDRWHGILDDWLAERGWAIMERYRTEGDGYPDEPWRCPWRFPGYWIGGVKSPRYDGDHAVVMYQNRIVYDPSPNRADGHCGYTSAEYFVPLNVAAFAYYAFRNTPPQILRDSLEPASPVAAPSERQETT